MKTYLPLASFAVVQLTLLILVVLPAQADNAWFSSTHKTQLEYPKGPISRNYSLDDRIRYQLWPYVWKPLANEPITHIIVNLGEQMVYVYQGDYLAAKTPTSTGKPGPVTPPGHYSIIAKDINHKSNYTAIPSTRRVTSWTAMRAPVRNNCLPALSTTPPTCPTICECATMA